MTGWNEIQLDLVIPDAVGWWNDCPASAVLPFDRSFLGDVPRNGETVLTGRLDGESAPHVLAYRQSDATIHWTVNVEHWMQWIRNEDYRPPHTRPWFTRLPFHYHAIPPSIRNAVLKILLAIGGARRSHNSDSQPDFQMPIGYEVLDTLTAKAQSDRSPEREPLLVLTHDIDSCSGFDWVKEIAGLEMSLGVRSSWNVVTSLYDMRHDILEWLVEQGFEIGVHGSRHDSRLAFLPADAMEARFKEMLELRDRYEVAGFRSPSWLRTNQLFELMSRYFKYDCSCLDVDRICPAGHGGVGTVRPFVRDGLVALPTTIPLEVPVFLGMEWNEVPEYWTTKVQWLLAVNGTILVNTHPDPHYSGNTEALAAYKRFLESCLSQGCTNRLPRVVADNVLLRQSECVSDA